MKSKTSIYIHYPFCASRCPYCAFNCYAGMKIDNDAIRKAYIEELKHYHSKLPNRKIETIFFGGGTPSLMPIRLIDEILSTIDELWGVEQGVEVSLEANPTSIEINKFRKFKELGINRISVGIQSLYDKDLKYLGREHSASEGIKAIECAQQVFNDRYSIDLIYARTGHKLSDWLVELEEAVKLSPYHLSLYQLSIEENTPFHKRGVKTPNEIKSGEFYERTNEFLAEKGIPMYEVSNYAKLGYEAQHNDIYWRSGEWLGIGAGAHGRISFGEKEDGYLIRSGTENILLPNEWVVAIKEKGSGVLNSYKLSKQEYIEEFFMMGLRRRDGISSKDLSYLDEEFKNIVNQKNLELLEKEGFIEFDDNRIKVIQKGFVILNSIIEKILL